MSDQAEKKAWHWVSPDGTQDSGARTELRAKLAERSLPAATLVWTRSWAEWLPANRVREFADAVPDGRQPPVEPRRDPKVVAPPAVRKSISPPRPGASSDHSSGPASAPLQPAAPPSQRPPPMSAASPPSRRTAPPPPPKRSAPGAAAPAPHLPTSLNLHSTLIGAGPPPPAPAPATPTKTKTTPPPPPKRDKPGGAGTPALVPQSGGSAPEPRTVGRAPIAPAQAPTELSWSGVPAPPDLAPPPKDAVTAPLDTGHGVVGAPAPTAQRPAPMAALPPLVGPSPAPRRPQFPTLSDEYQGATATLRPPGAVPPPPRGLPTAVTYEPAAAPPPAMASAAPAEPSVLAPGLGHDEVQHYPSSPFHSIPDPSEGVAKQYDTVPPARASAVGAEPRPSRMPSRAALFGLSGLSVVLAVTLIVTLLTRGEEEAPAPAPSAPPSASAPKKRKPLGCLLAAPPAKLAPTMERAVPPRLLELEDGRLAVGFAAARKQATGVIVDPATLDVRQFFDESDDKDVRGVVPLAGSTFTFVADRDGGGLTAPSSLETPRRTLVGFTSQGLAKSEPDRKPDLIWPMEGLAGTEVTEPRAARVGSAGHALVFRRGGTSGEVLLGWLDSELSPRTRVEVVPAGARFVGTPSVAGNASSLVVAFAGRDAESAPWSIRLARAQGGKIPASFREFPTPAGGLPGSAIAPSIAPLGADGWVLQWTQGGSGAYEVRVQQLDADLEPLGTPVSTSPKGANAGQGAIGVGQKRALSVYVLTVAGRDELWGAALECL